MYKTKFRSKDFLTTKQSVFDMIDFMDDGDELRDYYVAIVDLNNHELINELDKIGLSSPYQDIHDRKKELVRGILSVNLGLGFEIHYLLDRLSEEFQAIQETAKTLYELKTRFENHRHPLDKTYGEKPVW